MSLLEGFYIYLGMYIVCMHTSLLTLSLIFVINLQKVFVEGGGGSGEGRLESQSPRPAAPTSLLPLVHSPTLIELEWLWHPVYLHASQLASHSSSAYLSLAEAQLHLYIAYRIIP